MESKLKKFTVSAARPLPVIVLADVSGSMAEYGKIQALNQSLRDMITSFSQADELRAEIHVCVITFGHAARTHVPLGPATAVTWQDLGAQGSTPLGAALTLASELIDDKERIPSRAYRPTIVLVSDGQPTDDWHAGLARLAAGRAAKADRIALAIGADADEVMLRAFLDDPERKVFHAEDAGKIKDFFRFFTMSVTTRSRSANPNAVPAVGDPFKIEDF